jgi:hypothetical protein
MFAARDEEAALALASLGVTGLLLVLALVVHALFTLTQMRAIDACLRRNRTMEPGLVWLNFVPVFHLFWQFWTVIQIGNSLKREFRDREMDRGGSYGKATGILLYTLGLLGSVIFNGGLLVAVVIEEKVVFLASQIVYGVLGLVSLVLFVVYWVQLAGHTRRLKDSRSKSFSYTYAGRSYSY